MSSVPEEEKPVYAWQRTTSPSSINAANQAQRQQVIPVLAAFLGTFGIMAGLIYWLIAPDPKIVLLSIGISEYSTSWELITPFADRDSDLFDDAHNRGLLPEFEQSLGKKDANAQQRSQLLDRLDSLRKEKDRPVILHLSGLALVGTHEDKEGVFLLPANANPRDTKSWIAIDEILDRVQACPSKKKLLLLDLGHPFTDPFRGVIQADVSYRLIQHLRQREKEGNLPFYVFCSCSPGEYSWPLDEERLSVFAHYIAEALSGAADRALAEGQDNGQVTLQEFIAYVRNRVNTWCRNNRNVSQTPLLLGMPDEKDFVLNYLKTGHVAQFEVGQNDRATYAPELLAGWKLRDRWLEEGVHRISPQLVRLWELDLMRAEAVWRYGSQKQVADLFANTFEGSASKQAKRTAVRNSLISQTSKLTLPSVSLWAKEPLSDKDKETLRELNLLLERMRNQISRLVSSSSGKVDSIKESEGYKEFLKKAVAQPQLGSVALWDALTEMPWRNLESKAQKELLLLFVGLIDEVQLQTDIKFAEGFWLQPIIRKFDREYRGIDESILQPLPQTVRSLLQTERKANETIADLRPEAFLWVQADLIEAERWKLEGERSFLETKRALDRVQKEVEAHLSKAREAYQKALTNAKTIRQAFLDLEDTQAMLPALYDALIARQQANANDVRSWSVLVRSIDELRQLLSPSEEQMKDVNDLQSRVGKITTVLLRIRERREELRKPFTAAEVQRLTQHKEGSISEYRQLQALLDSPLLSANDRAAVWKRCREIGKKMHEGSKASDQAQYERSQPIPNVEPDNVERLRNEEAERVKMRLLLQRELLWLADPRREEDIELILSPDDPKRAAMEKALKRFWIDEMPEDLDVNKAKAPNTPVLLERRLGVQMLYDRYLILTDAAEKRLLVRQSANRSVQRQWFEWLRKRTSELSERLKEVPTARDFFDQFAENCQKRVEELTDRSDR